MKTLLAACIAFSLIAFGCASKQNAVKEAEWHYDIAWDLFQKGDMTRSLSSLLKSRELDPKRPETHNLLGLLYMYRGYYERAEPSFKEAIKLKPKYSDARNNLCGLYIRRSLWDDAIQQCSKAVEDLTYATPERAYNNLGYAHYKKGNRMKAIQYYKEALLHRRDYFLAHQNLGAAYYDLRKYRLASNHLKQATDGCKFCPEPFYRLGITQFKLGKRKTAMQNLKKCQELDKDGEFGKLCREFLKNYRQ